MKTKLTILILLCSLLACSSEPKVLHTFQYVSDGSLSVLAQLQRGHEVKADSSSMGILVKSIDGVEQTRTAFWLYFINDEAASAPASDFTPQPGDTVEWRLMELY